MKLSAKFREDKNPLLRAKVPFKLGSIPVVSGVALGTKQELALQLATRFSRGPIIKVAFKPHDPDALSLVFKSGFGPWGSPAEAPLVFSAEICLRPKMHQHYVSLQIKPRFGSFSIVKSFKSVNLQSAQQDDLTTARILPAHENGEQNSHLPPLTASNDILSSSLSGRGADAPSQKTNDKLFDKEPLQTSSVHFANAVNRSNHASRVEGFDSRNGNVSPRLERLVEADEETETPFPENGLVAHVQHGRLHESWRKGCLKSLRAYSLASAQDAFRGIRIINSSSLPLGNHSRFNIRWGLMAATDFLQGWDGSLQNLRFAQRPSFLLEKVSFEQIAFQKEKFVYNNEVVKLSEHDLPMQFVHENRDLAHVALLCNTMKKQLHMMHAENQLLRRVMEEMKFHIDSNSSPRILRNALEAKLKDGHLSASRLPPTSFKLDGSTSVWTGRENGNCDGKSQKSNKGRPVC